jgi:Methyltransferase domain
MTVTAHRTRNHANMYGFARHARVYDLLSGVLASALYRRVVADVSEVALPAGSVVLDVGTGPGRVARLIAAAYPTVEVEGVDLSPEMIARATSTANRTRTSNLPCGSATSLRCRSPTTPSTSSSPPSASTTGTTRRPVSTRSSGCSVPADKPGSMTSAPRSQRHNRSPADSTQMWPWKAR